MAYQRLKKFHLHQKLKSFKMKDSFKNVLEYKSYQLSWVSTSEVLQVIQAQF